MPERGFASETWDSDEWFHELNVDQRYLFIYLWTNSHCNPAGMYHIILSTIAYETKFKQEDLPSLLKSLVPKVIWYPESNLIWVKNFLKRQAKSSKFLQAAAKSLTIVKDGDAIQELLNYNLSRYSISIPYQYYIDRISILTRDTVPVPVTVTNSVSSNLEEGIVKGGKPTSGNATPATKSEDDESLSPVDLSAEREIIDTWFSVKGFDMPRSAAAELVTRLRTGFPDVDLLFESRGWATRKISEPLTPDSRPASQLWNWMAKAREIAGRNVESASKRRGARREHTKGFDYRICRKCGYKTPGKTLETQCPNCGGELAVDYTAGVYGHMVRH